MTIIDWEEVYKVLQLDMGVYEKINAGENFTSAMISKDEYAEDDSE